MKNGAPRRPSVFSVGSVVKVLSSPVLALRRWAFAPHPDTLLASSIRRLQRAYSNKDHRREHEIFISPRINRA